MSDPLNPSPALLVKLGSIIVHADEALGKKGHQFDVEAIKSLLADVEVINWLGGMDKMAFLPRKRTP